MNLSNNKTIRPPLTEGVSTTPTVSSGLLPPAYQHCLLSKHVESGLTSFHSNLQVLGKKIKETYYLHLMKLRCTAECHPHIEVNSGCDASLCTLMSSYTHWIRNVTEQSSVVSCVRELSVQMRNHPKLSFWDLTNRKNGPIKSFLLSLPESAAYQWYQSLLYLKANGAKVLYQSSEFGG